MIKDEHFIPSEGLNLQQYIQDGNMAGVHHLIRYHWALKVIKDHWPTRKIIDIACGSGYGSYLLASKFPKCQILGIDYDPEAIQQARQKYSSPNLEYHQGDAITWNETIGQDKFDVIVSFDTLEHVPHRELMLSNIVQHMSRTGILIFSTPCGGPLNLQPEWEFHRIEYSAQTLYDFLRRYFRRVIRPDSLIFPHLEVFDELTGTNTGYLLLMNPLICKRPINIWNPYQGMTHTRIERYLKLVRIRGYWRKNGTRWLVKQVYERLRNRLSSRS
ncbi:MAG: class I SAM-dependent methyltransferase [Anaerolineales bacterium]|nr:class I SAM-dependent methyltransferase [Anaerolineales bacterium]